MKAAFIEEKRHVNESADAVQRLFPQVSPVRCYREKDVLRLVPISRSKFAEMRRQGIGPREVRIGTAKIFRECDLVEWLTGLYGTQEARERAG